MQEREHTTIPKSHGVVAGGADSHHTTYPSELLLDRAPSLTHPRLLALPIPGIMQRKQVNSCSIVPLPHSSPIVGVADPWHYAAQTGELLLDRAPPSLIPDCWRCRSLALCSANRFALCELLLDRRTFPQPNEIVAATDHSRAVTYTGGDENGEGGDEKGKEEMRMGKEEMRMGKEEMRMGKEEMRMGKEEMRMGKEEMRMGKEEMRMGKEEMRMGKEEMRMGKEEMRMGKEEMRMGKEEMRMGKEEMRMGKEEMRMGKEEMRKGWRR
ncbi:hypothetical protein BLNAU_12831 [Blattamonas nauphoetae]|uniref:Uncharacterized protein n=1 Tax=Blattamonas nauphoetae TaxID=2049346 RepID=A0ABQ9XNV1_9EUKA|nr:hypothetical protein BLNAU_12831 [Blattamonas nauphoetae]